MFSYFILIGKYSCHDISVTLSITPLLTDDTMGHPTSTYQTDNANVHKFFLTLTPPAIALLRREVIVVARSEHSVGAREVT